jgi:hypothetical protein
MSFESGLDISDSRDDSVTIGFFHRQSRKDNLQFKVPLPCSFARGQRIT